MGDNKTADNQADKVKLLDEFDALLKDKGTVMQSLKVDGSSGGGVLRGMIPMLEMVCASCDSEEDRKMWWRSFCVEAHLICLEHVGMDEAAESLLFCARIVAERVKSETTQPQ